MKGMDINYRLPKNGWNNIILFKVNSECDPNCTSSKISTHVIKGAEFLKQYRITQNEG